MGEGYVEISEEGGKYELTVKSKSRGAQWLFKCKSFPPAAYEFFDNHGMQIHGNHTDKYIINYDATGRLTFRIVNIELNDYGIYRVVAFNEYQTAEINVSLIVKEKPLTIVHNTSIFVGEEASLVCETAGFPASNIKWSFTPCELKPKWPTCDNTKRKEFSEEEAITTPNTTLAQISRLSLSPDTPGLITCTATNSEGTDTSEAYIIISDLREALEYSGIDNDENIASVGDPAKIHCAALAYNFTGDLAWFHNNKPVANTTNVIVTDTNTEYSYHKTVEWKSMTKEDSGLYECRVSKITNDETDAISRDINVIGIVYFKCFG